MNPIIIYENEIYAIGYSYETDWPNLCYTVDRAAYWSIVNFSNMDGDAYSKIANKRGEEIAFWLCKEIGDFEMRYFFGERVDSIENVPHGMEVLKIPEAKYAVFTLDAQYVQDEKDKYVQQIRALWQYISEEWFPSGGYQYDDEKCNFEVYSGSQMKIYIPVR